MDPFEKLLTDLVAHMMTAWQLEESRESPLGELAAESAAVLQFYREQHRSFVLDQGDETRRRFDPPSPVYDAVDPKHWSDPWRREHGK